jgi:flagellar hook assembly protein FlgD
MISGHAVWAHLNLSLLDFEPNSLHSLELEAVDLMGNRGVDTLTFTASPGFSLLHVAAHPNPFSDEVIIAWELTDVPQRIRALIYTSSGRHIRTIEPPNPHIGYDSVTWYGRDDLGQPVANGVYYLKLIVENDAEKVTKIVKLARLR